jgi:GNAT superfamily N-acetyltransferase
MSSEPVTTWYLEQTSPADLVPAAVPGPDAGVEIVRARVPSPQFSRFLYASVGADVAWVDRLVWSERHWREYLERPGTETWVAYEHGTPAGYAELDASGPDEVELAYFGLLPDFRGRRIGAHLLSHGAARAWDLASRWPRREATRRVWLHTCSLDSPYARPNYERRGFRLYRTVTEPVRPVLPGGAATVVTPATPSHHSGQRRPHSG